MELRGWGEPMPIAFKKPFTADTQELRDAVDYRNTRSLEVTCGVQGCPTSYVLVYHEDTSAETVAAYETGIRQGMCNCAAHPSTIRLSF